MNRGYMLEKANQIVYESFKDKKDLGGYSYLLHLRRVADKFKNEKWHITAMLHDLLEDCPEWNEERLRQEFPKEICDAVICLTKLKGEEYDFYLQRVKSNDIARLVKIEDLKDNMNVSRLNELTDKDVARLRKYIKALKFLKQ